LLLGNEVVFATKLSLIVC